MNRTDQGRWLRRIAIAGVALASVAPTGCDVESRAFRTAALPAVKTGASQILNGLLDGFFAAVTPDPTTDTTSDATSKN